MRYKPPNDIQRRAFHQGGSRFAYELLGAHPVTQDDQEYWHFAVWAPNARAVNLTGEFCAWDTLRYPMKKQFDGVWELRLPASTFSVSSDPERYAYPDAAEKLLGYKYAVYSFDGEMHLKADPYAFSSELRPNTASRLCDLSGYHWQDEVWMKKRSRWNAYTSPINIYEMHLGSWRRNEDGSMLSYIEIAELLIPYIKDMGYTHVELLPVMEHPLDMSWGYQVTGYFAPTARHGKPHEFMQFVDMLHQADIGVILDWVPAHFPRDEIGLRCFDGTPCYEHADPRRSEMPQWGTMLFDYARGEVCSFLISNACFWLEYYHVDGLRCDAVSAMLYHDFSREDSWLANQYGGNENLDAISFLKRFNEMVYRDFPGVMTIAEESTAFANVTQPTYLGGLGFGFKWNMGWMNDMLRYVKMDPIYRKHHQDKLTFSLHYAFNENFILPFSHDEVVHGKHSMLDKNPGDLWQKFAGLRALYGYTMAHPGKKLLFMGGEFAHFIEWKYDDQLDWFLLVYDRHPQVQAYVRQLNKLYAEHPELYEVEDSWAGFQWLQANDRDNSLIIFVRYSAQGRALVCMTNFTPQFIPRYRFGLPRPGVIRELLNSDLEQFGGSNQYNPPSIKSEPVAQGEFSHSAEVCVPPLSCVYFEYIFMDTPTLLEEE